MEQVFDINLLKRKMLRKYPAFGSTIASVKYQIVDSNHPVKTAATDGKTIYVNPEFMSGLSEEEQVFVFAHEVCHIALNHILRSKGKDPRLWNIATDAVINQFLKKDGLPMVEGGVDIADALKYNAEELYNKLLEEQQQENKQSGNNGDGSDQNEDKSGQDGSSEKQAENSGKNSEKNSEQNNAENSESKQNQNSGDNLEQNQDTEDASQGGGSSGNESENQVGHDSHSMWEEAVKQAEEKPEDKHGSNSEQKQLEEKEAFAENEKEKVRRAEEIMSKINSSRRGIGGESEEAYITDVGEAGKPVTNWKRLLIRTLEIEDEAWGHKFSDKSSGYAARIEDVEYDEMAETEIILDTSGSVSVELLKSFLRQVKTVLKTSKIKVGTFSNSFHGWIEIKSESDIDNLKIRVGGGTNFDAASRAFSRRKDVNKICFTDGCDGGDAGITDKRSDIVWISFENPHFKPDNGKVIFVPESTINLETRKKDNGIER